MHRLFSKFTLLIAAFWLMAGVSVEIAGDSSNDSGRSGVSEQRPRLKASKAIVPSGKISRVSAQIELGMDPRKENASACVPRTHAPRVVEEAKFSRPVAHIPAAPSLTGQIVMLV